LVKVKKLFDFTRSENDIYFETEGVVFLQSQLVTFHFQRCSEEGLLPMFFFAISASRYLLKITLKLHQNVNIFLSQKKVNVFYSKSSNPNWPREGSRAGLHFRLARRNTAPVGSSFSLHVQHSSTHGGGAT
jgi:hypothetical protein